MEKRRMCPDCRAFITTSDKVCPYCGVQLGPRIVDLRSSAVASSFIPRLTSATMVILLINIACFGFEMLARWAWGQGDVGLSFGPYVFHGQWWRLITAGFLHEGILHIAMNSYALLILVTEADQFYGTSRFIVAYVFSTFTGFLLSCLVHPTQPSLGASAAAFGLMGLMLAMTVGRRTHPLAQAVRSQYTQWLLFSLVLSFMGRVDWAAHIGGFIGGFAVGLVAGLPTLPGSPRENFWRLAAGFAVALTLYCFFQDALWIFRAPRGL